MTGRSGPQTSLDPRVFVIPAVLVATVLIVGRYGVSTNYDLSVSLSASGDAPGVTRVSSADISLRDDAGREVAGLVTDGEYGAAYLLRPAGTVCLRVENGDLRGDYGRAWMSCVKNQRKWLARELPKVTRVVVTRAGCKAESVTTFHVSDDMAYVWWIPLPHVGGRPVKYVSLWLELDESRCVLSSRQ